MILARGPRRTEVAGRFCSTGVTGGGRTADTDLGRSGPAVTRATSWSGGRATPPTLGAGLAGGEQLRTPCRRGLRAGRLTNSPRWAGGGQLVVGNAPGGALVLSGVPRRGRGASGGRQGAAAGHLRRLRPCWPVRRPCATAGLPELGVVTSGRIGALCFPATKQTYLNRSLAPSQFPRAARLAGRWGGSSLPGGGGRCSSTSLATDDPGGWQVARKKPSAADVPLQLRGARSRAGTFQRKHVDVTERVAEALDPGGPCAGSRGYLLVRARGAQWRRGSRPRQRVSMPGGARWTYTKHDTRDSGQRRDTCVRLSAGHPAPGGGAGAVEGGRSWSRGVRVLCPNSLEPIPLCSASGSCADRLIRLEVAHSAGADRDPRSRHARRRG